MRALFSVSSGVVVAHAARTAQLKLLHRDNRQCVDAHRRNHAQAFPGSPHLCSFVAHWKLTLLASQSGREGFKGFWGAKFRGERHRKVPRPRPPRPSTQALERLHHWNSIAIDASGLDHTPVAEGEDRDFGEQLGPGRASRAIAIVHLAIYEAVNAIDGGHESFTGLNRAPRKRVH